MDTTFYDIEQITKKIKGQTCYLPPIEINSKRKTRTAYIYVKPEDYQHKIWNVPVGKDRIIYITPSNHSVCSVCGDHSHNVSTCNRYETLEPYLRPNKEQRVEVTETKIEHKTTVQDITAQDPDPESTPHNLRKDINLLSKEINTLKANQEQQEKITEDLHQQIRKFTESQEQMAKQITTTSENIQAINRTQSMILEQIQLLHRPTNNNSNTPEEHAPLSS
ncbi:hypothetical protein RclHR1_04270002 [Rhizophagus clarus]|uniref:Uncharacterized protein n=1 Tax=Rhizophagus clarus TaxID=94130 RepID=A0A2Z6RHQ1_9GLOM|nr:hypothetical protein RclHR1_04270002 [Rhizophagus clarus]